jgi:hypothetical protein
MAYKPHKTVCIRGQKPLIIKEQLNDMTTAQLRNECNNNGISCLSKDRKFKQRDTMIRQLQYIQNAGSRKTTPIYGPIPVALNKIKIGLTQNQLTVHSARALVLSCMDFRLIDDIMYYMNTEGFHNGYDQFIMAGASAGYIRKPDWAKNFEEHLALAVELHNIKEVIIIDHMKCGAYKLFFNAGKAFDNDDDERAEHVRYLGECASVLRNKYKDIYPGLIFSTYLMNLTGAVERV